MSQSNGLRTTPLTSLHIELGARMVPFAGYSMPVQFSEGIIAEHLTPGPMRACLTSPTWARFRSQVPKRYGNWRP